jgi:CMP-N-acetylneuraminic acid synthetase
LQATSPFRDAKDIDNAINIFEKRKLNSLVSVNKRKIFLWKKIQNKLSPITYNFNNRKRLSKD